MQAKQRFPPNDWKIVLLVDTQELVKSKKFNHQEFLQRLRQEIPCETRSLPTGDYLWVARRRTLSSSTNADEEEENEIVLDWIVERKTDKNLQYSLWLESKTYPPMKQMQIQSLKMKWSQIQNRVLLVEKGPKPWDVTVQQRNMVASYLKNLKQKDPSFTIRYTSGVEHTIQYLVKLHKDIEKNATIDSTTTTTLAQIRQRIRMGVNSLHFELYLSLRRIPRLGEEKIQFLRNLYPTREQMATAFHTNKLTKDKLSKLQLPNAKRPFGKKLAESIHQAVISTTSKAASSVAAFNPASPRNASFDDGSSTSSEMLPPSPFCRESIKNQQNQSCISSTTPSGMLVTPHRNSTPGVTRNVLQQPLQSFSLSSSDDDDYTIPPPSPFFSITSAF